MQRRLCPVEFCCVPVPCRACFEHTGAGVFGERAARVGTFGDYAEPDSAISCKSISMRALTGVSVPADSKRSPGLS